MAADTESARPGQAAPAAADGGVIHNIGYRRYADARLGRGSIFLALTWHSLRAAFGFGRGAKAKIFPAILFVIICLPAVVNAVSLATGPHTSIITYDVYVPSIRSVAMLIFVALEAPNLVSTDLRNHMLPLYFARPIRRSDYPLAKLLAFVIACLLMIEIPLVILYIGNITQVHSAHAVWEQTLQFGPGLLYGAAWALLLASIGLLLASLTGKRVFAICAVGIPLFFTFIVAHTLSHVGQQAFRAVPSCAGRVIRQGGSVICLHPAFHPPALASLAGLISPFTLLGGLLRWLGAPNTSEAGNLQATIIGQYGDIYGLVFVLLTVAVIGGLILRYRKIGVA